ncbi:MAG: phosphate signaling complex protein PhoU [Planctomycetes bacterium]|nr:phosphate signaling complex protein PhoU [Planctomycetota bacterium]
MAIHYQREIELLKKRVLGLSTIVEESVHRAIAALERHDERSAQKVVQADDEIDLREVDLEEDCLKILALYKPVANDLRFIVTVMKINSDLERIGDLASNIAKTAIYLAYKPRQDLPDELIRMAELAQGMLHGSLDALIEQDSQRAREIWARDVEVDALNRHVYEQIVASIGRHPERADAYVRILSVARRLERVADHATNIAENVIYMVEGAIVRHRSEQVREAQPRQLTA